MPTRRRAGTAGLVLHVLNRAVRRAPLFERDADYQAFIETLIEAQTRHPVRLLAYCVMPNHFHFVLWPRFEGDLSRFMCWLTATHSKRWHAFRGSRGTGSVYQGRYKAFPVQTDTHFLTLCRYVERNPLRAGLVRRSRDWRWSSLHHRCKNFDRPLLDPWPILPPSNWEELLDQAERDVDVSRLRRCVRRNAPFGEGPWVLRQSPDVDSRR